MNVEEIQQKINEANVDSLRIDFPDLHGICLYPSDGALLEPLRDVLEGRRILTPSARTELQASVEARFGAQAAVLRHDEALVAIVDRLGG